MNGLSALPLATVAARGGTGSSSTNASMAAGAAGGPRGRAGSVARKIAPAAAPKMRGVSTSAIGFGKYQ